MAGEKAVIGLAVDVNRDCRGSFHCFFVAVDYLDCDSDCEIEKKTVVAYDRIGLDYRVPSAQAQKCKWIGFWCFEDTFSEKNFTRATVHKCPARAALEQV